jgi:4-amino-4-deoxy-L-arabinose transferase-like glycosyltransferase
MRLDRLSLRARKQIIRATIILIVCIVVALFIYVWNNTNRFRSSFSIEIRFRVAKGFIRYYGIRLFGSQIVAYEDLNDNYYHHAFDMGYVNMLVKNGILVSIVVALSLIKMVKRTIKNGDIILTAIFLAYAIYFIMENLPANIAFNPFIILFGGLLNGGYEKSRTINANIYMDNVQLV